jgi:hypothetical protein
MRFATITLFLSLCYATPVKGQDVLYHTDGTLEAEEAAAEHWSTVAEHFPAARAYQHVIPRGARRPSQRLLVFYFGRALSLLYRAVQDSVDRQFANSACRVHYERISSRVVVAEWIDCDEVDTDVLARHR